MTLGVRDLKTLAIPAGWDGAYLAKQAIQDGTTYDALFDQLTSRVALFNQGLQNHPWLGWISSPTTRQTVRYATGTGGAWEDHTEYRGPNPQHAEMTGHMIERKKKDRGLSWTWDYLNDAILEDVQEDIRVFLDTALDAFEQEALTRFFKAEDVTVGDTGTSPGLVGGGSLTYTPRDYNGKSFASSHTHLLRYASGDLAEGAAAMTSHLSEHGHMGPYDLWISDVDKATWQALSNDTHRVYFREIPKEGIVFGSNVTVGTASTDAPDAIGFLDTPSGIARIRPSVRIPTNYAGIYKPYNVDDSRNPLRWFYKEQFGRGIVSIAGDKIGFPQYPVMGYAEFGFGIGGDRTNGAVLRIAASGNYTTPTIS